MTTFVNNAEKVRRQIDQQLAGGLNNGVESLISDAREGAPTGATGKLKAGIQVIERATPDRLEAIGASQATYSAVVNRGSNDTEAVPFWTTAWLRMKDGFGRFFTR